MNRHIFPIHNAIHIYYPSHLYPIPLPSSNPSSPTASLSPDPPSGQVALNVYSPRDYLSDVAITLL